MTVVRVLATTLVVLLLTTAVGAAPLATDEAPANGPPVDVAVLRPVSDDPVLVAASARIRLELGAAGLTSALVDIGGDGFAARVALVREDGVATIDVLGTPAVGALRHRRLRVTREEGGEDPTVLAVRAVELLRGIRLEVRQSVPVERAPAAEPEPLGDAPEARGPAHATWRFEAGLGVLAARPFAEALGLGPAIAVAGAIAPQVSFTATFAGPFSTDRPGTPDGSAHTREEMGAIGLRLDTWWRGRLNAHAVGTVGLHHASAAYDGRGVPAGPSPTLHVFTPQSVWDPAITLAVGASLRVSPRLGLSLQVAAILVTPALELISNGRSLGTLGGPSLLPTLSAWTTL